MPRRAAVALFIGMTFVGTAVGQLTKKDCEQFGSFDAYAKGTTFPYSAPAAKTSRLRSAADKLRVGMKPADVLKLIGSPDYSSSEGENTDQFFGCVWTYVVEDPTPAEETKRLNREVVITFSLDMGIRAVNFINLCWPNRSMW